MTVIGITQDCFFPLLQTFASCIAIAKVISISMEYNLALISGCTIYTSCIKSSIRAGAKSVGISFRNISSLTTSCVVIHRITVSIELLLSVTIYFCIHQDISQHCCIRNNTLGYHACTLRCQHSCLQKWLTIFVEQRHITVVVIELLTHDAVLPLLWALRTCKYLHHIRAIHRVVIDNIQSIKVALIYYLKFSTWIHYISSFLG